MVPDRTILAVLVGVVVLATSLGLVAASDAGPADLVLQVENETAESATVILTTDADNVAGYQANVTYDPDVVQAVDAEGVDMNIGVENVDNTAGWAFYADGQATAEQQPTIIRIHFEFVGEGQTDLELVPEEHVDSQRYALLNDDDSEHYDLTLFGTSIGEPADDDDDDEDDPPSDGDDGADDEDDAADDEDDGAADEGDGADEEEDAAEEEDDGADEEDDGTDEADDDTADGDADDTEDGTDPDADDDGTDDSETPGDEQDDVDDAGDTDPIPGTFLVAALVAILGAAVAGGVLYWRR